MGRQYLANIGKVDSGVVSVSSPWADEGVYYPLEVEPYTPGHHFRKGKTAPRFRTKPRIAARLVERSLKMGTPFRAVVADSFHGENEGFRQRLSELKVGYVLALKPTHSWWHEEGEQIGAPWEAAQKKEAGEEKKRPLLPSWPKALRKVRGVVGAVDNGEALLEGVLGSAAPAKGAKRAA